MDFLAIAGEARGNQAHFRFIENFEEESFRLFKCEHLSGDWPADASYRMSDDYPENIELVDFLHVLDNTLVISREARNLLESASVPDMEYLPVRVLNHKGRAVKREYFVANVLRQIDCIDKDKTSFKWHPISKDRMKRVSNLTVDDSKIDSDVMIFRMQHLPFPRWIRRDLVDRLSSAGLQGFKATELKDLEL